MEGEVAAGEKLSADITDRAAQNHITGTEDNLPEEDNGKK